MSVILSPSPLSPLPSPKRLRAGRLSETKGLSFWLRINSVKSLIISTESAREILPCLPAGRGWRLNDNKTQSLRRAGMGERVLLRVLPLFVFFVICFVSSVSFPSPVEPAAEWHQLYTRIRDGLISKQEAQSRLKSLEAMLRGSYPERSPGKDEKLLCFPLEGYGPSAVGGKEGNGYQAQGYDFFDGNRHRGHPGHDIFIRDRDRDGLDDVTGKPVKVISTSSGIVVSINLGWEPSSPIRGGNYVWIYEPIKDRYYYYAHLSEIFVKIGQIVSRGEWIGTVGRTGKNAHPKRSPTHLHFTVHHSVQGYPKPVNTYKELANGDCQ